MVNEFPVFGKLVKANGIYTYIWDDDTLGANYFNQNFKRQAYNMNTTDIQQNFNGDFTIGGVRNRLLVGLDYFSRVNIDNSSGWAVGRVVTPQGDVVTTNPLTDEDVVPVPLSLSAVNALVDATGETANSHSKNSFYSAYISDVINITPNLLAMASLRVDYYDTKGEQFVDGDEFDQTLVSPKFGLIYQPIADKLSLFANYMNGFINVEPYQTYDLNNDPTGVKIFKPSTPTR